jgi:hypothetical protein
MSKAPIIGLVDFMKQKRREVCPVCKLSAEVRAQLETAAEKGIKRRDVLEWLHSVVGVAVTDQELTSHRNGRHGDETA